MTEDISLDVVMIFGAVPTSRDRSWIHTDKWNAWGGVLFMTPNAPLTSGTAFYRFKDGATCEEDGIFLDNQKEIDKCSQDLTKWELVDRVGNVFNRLVLFNAHRYHMSPRLFRRHERKRKTISGIFLFD